jgi:hypothetical protein
MKKIILLFIVGIAASCSPDQDVDIIVNTTNYYGKQISKDTINVGIEFPVINDTIVP